MVGEEGALLVSQPVEEGCPRGLAMTEFRAGYSV